MKKRINSHNEIVDRIYQELVRLHAKFPHAPRHILIMHSIHPAGIVPYGRNVDYGKLAASVSQRLARSHLQHFEIYEANSRILVAMHKKHIDKDDTSEELERICRDYAIYK